MQGCTVGGEGCPGVFSPSGFSHRIKPLFTGFLLACFAVGVVAGVCLGGAWSPLISPVLTGSEALRGG